MANDESPDWYRDAVIYEIPVRAFYDSNADGVGDFRGLIEKLDYVRDLGVTAIWVLPFYPSPLRDGGYDIADYRRVDPMFGTMRDFRRFLEEAHRRDLRVITELVINHTSDQHPWFQRARKSPPNSRYRNYYVWSGDPARYADARIIFQDYEASNWSWDPVAEAYFWHRFYSHQPDLNFDNPEVRQQVLETCGFWLKMGVDGMRLDAIPYLFEREGTNCENLPETHAFLKELRAYMDSNFKDRMLLAEANQWPEDAAAYFGDGDECHMNFHFPLMPRIFMSVQLESSSPIHDILSQTPTIPAGCQWALFLRNHDELTLEMVTDEDRDFMYDAYAADPQMRVNLGIRRRLAPLVRSRDRIELMNALLLSMPGTPVLYYGDEIGMGDNIYLGDRDAVRTPMQWSSDRNGGFSRANPQKLFLPAVIDPEYHFASVNVEAQEANPESLLWWTKRTLALRHEHPVFGRGDLELLSPDNGKVLAFLRSDEHERILVVGNMSRHSQFVSLDLSAYAGSDLVELFGGARFPQIGELPYLITLGPHGYYWFRIVAPTVEASADATHRLTTRSEHWTAILDGKSRGKVEELLAEWMEQRRWYRGKARDLQTVVIRELVTVGHARVAVVEAKYRDHEHDRVLYLVPLAFATGVQASDLTWSKPHTIVAELATASEEGVLFDAAHDPELAHRLLDLLLDGKRRRGAIRGRAGKRVSEVLSRELRGPAGAERRERLPVRASKAEQSNTSLIFGQDVVLKLLRVLEPGEHPEAELGRFLTEQAGFTHTPRFAGALTFEGRSGPPLVMAVAHEFVPHQGDGWEYTLDAAARALDRAHELDREGAALPPALRADVAAELPEATRELLGPYHGTAVRLGERVGELHLALAGDALGPEPFSLLHQREMYQAARGRLGATLAAARKVKGRLEERERALLDELLGARDALDARLKRIHATKIEADRIRIHGDLHLGQVLVAGGDLLIIDFEGEPARSLRDRARTRSPLRDVAGMLRSFDYGVASALRHRRAADWAPLEPWARVWSQAVGATFFAHWRATVADARFIPADPEHLDVLLDFSVLEKCIYEIGYELNNRPDWVTIPLGALVRALREEDA
ncbi:MAG: maltose alpha-D-glucosyltransferase [Sandaracinaceae bacterium]